MTVTKTPPHLAIPGDGKNGDATPASQVASKPTVAAVDLSPGNRKALSQVLDRIKETGDARGWSVTKPPGFHR